MKTAKQTGYIVRSNINPNLYLCTNGEFLAQGFSVLVIALTSRFTKRFDAHCGHGDL